MVKITLTHDGETQVDEGDLVLAFVYKQHSDGETICADTHLFGKGNGVDILTCAATILGSLIPRMIDKKTRRVLAYARMLQALSDGFDGQSAEIADIGYPTDGKEARDGEKV